MRNTNAGRSKGSIIVIVLLLVAYLLLRACGHTSQTNNSNRRPGSTGYTNSNRRDHRQAAFRYNTVYYTKHAKCRMSCRHIDESEVKEILDEGSVNYSKSEMNASPCPKYALEGITHDHQHVRIIVGNCQTRASIVTVIDLDKEWSCDCGDARQSADSLKADEE